MAAPSASHRRGRIQRRARRQRIIILGGGHGVASVLGALHGELLELTVIVTTADDGGSSGELRRRWGIAAVGDMRRTLIAMAGEDGDFGRAFARPVSIARLGRHPLGNLVLAALSDAFGELEAASAWICDQLGLTGRVLPATTFPVSLVAEEPEGLVRGESAIGAAPGRIVRLRFDPRDPSVPTAALEAITDADWVLLGPGSLFTSVLAVSALPEIVSELASTHARVLWICNLAPQYPETLDMTAGDHLDALRRHGVRVDAVLYDPDAPLTFTAQQLAESELPALSRHMQSTDPAVHDPASLHAALYELFTGAADPLRPVATCAT